MNPLRNVKLRFVDSVVRGEFSGRKRPVVHANGQDVAVPDWVVAPGAASNGYFACRERRYSRIRHNPGCGRGVVDRFEPGSVDDSAMNRRPRRHIGSLSRGNVPLDILWVEASVRVARRVIVAQDGERIFGRRLLGADADQASPAVGGRFRADYFHAGATAAIQERVAPACRHVTALVNETGVHEKSILQCLRQNSCKSPCSLLFCGSALKITTEEIRLI